MYWLHISLEYQIINMNWINFLFTTFFFLFGCSFVNCRDSEGDILHKRKTVGDWKRRLWPYGVVHYSYAYRFNRKEREMIAAAMKEWSDKTCITFKEVSRGYRVKFQRTENSCYSLLGNTKKIHGDKSQPINLGEKCFRSGIGTIVHEIGHALGLIHEHKRPDRDDYLDMKWNNVQSGGRSQLEITKNGETFGLPYDFQSRMHYPPIYFARKNTFTYALAKNRALDVSQDKGKGLSFTDVAAINIMYQCGEKCSTKCPKPGFSDKDCKCVTPWSYAKDNCFNAIGDSACARKRKKNCVEMVRWGGYSQPTLAVNQKLVNQCRKFCGRCYRYIPSEWKKYANVPLQPVPGPNDGDDDNEVNGSGDNGNGGTEGGDGGTDVGGHGGGGHGVRYVRRRTRYRVSRHGGTRYVRRYGHGRTRYRVSGHGGSGLGGSRYGYKRRRRGTSRYGNRRRLRMRRDRSRRYHY